jgi:hypothetical protein
MSILMPYWPITLSPGSEAEELVGNVGETSYQHADGGNLENLAILQLLQRGATRGASIISTNIPLGATHDTETKKWIVDQDLCDTNVPITNSTQDSAFGSFFGYGNDGLFTESFVMPTGWVYTNNQIFKKEDLRPIVCKMMTLRNDGKPAVVKSTLTTIANSWWGIEAGREVTIVWLYNEVVRDFEAMLPADTQKAIKAARDKTADYVISMVRGVPEARPKSVPIDADPSRRKLKAKWPKQMYDPETVLASYPFLPTTLWGLTPQQINLLSMQTQYSVAQNIDLFSSVFTPGAPTPSPSTPSPTTPPTMTAALTTNSLASTTFIPNANGLNKERFDDAAKATGSLTCEVRTDSALTCSLSVTGGGSELIATHIHKCSGEDANGLDGATCSGPPVVNFCGSNDVASPPGPIDDKTKYPVECDNSDAYLDAEDGVSTTNAVNGWIVGQSSVARKVAVAGQYEGTAQDLYADIVANPTRYYFNVHSKASWMYWQANAVGKNKGQPVGMIRGVLQAAQPTTRDPIV